MIDDRRLEDYHDEALTPDQMDVVAEALRRDPALRERLAGIRRRDDLVAEALTGASTRVGRRRAAWTLLPLAAAAAVALALVGVRVANRATQDGAAPVASGTTGAAAPGAGQTTSYEPVRLVFSLPLPAGRGSPASPAASDEALARVPEDAAPGAPAVPLPETLSKAEVLRVLTALPMREQIEVCRAWAAEPLVKGFVFDYLKDLNERGDLTHDLAELGAELRVWPGMDSWVESNLPKETARPSSSAGAATPERA